MQFCGSRWNSNLRTVFRLFFSVNFSILAHSAQCTCPEILYTKISCDIKTCSIVFLHWSDTHIFHWKYSMACQHYHWWDKMGHLCWKTALESNCTWASILLAIANFHSFLWSFGSILNLLNEKKKSTIKTIETKVSNWHVDHCSAATDSGSIGWHFSTITIRNLRLKLWNKTFPL